MKKMKKVLACAVAATMTASLAACSSGNSTETAAPTAAAKTDATEAAKEDTTAAASGEKVTVTFWDENAGDERTQYYMDIIENFEKENPDIHIEYLGLSSGDALSKYQTAIAAGETPDVGGLNNSWGSNCNWSESLCGNGRYVCCMGWVQRYRRWLYADMPYL